MTILIDLVAGDPRELRLGIEAEAWDLPIDRSPFAAHLSLGGGLDPTWLDLFSEAARTVTGGSDPVDFIDARQLAALDMVGERLVERVDRRWVEAVASLRDADLDRVAALLVDLVREEIGPLGAEDKPMIRRLVEDLVAFCRAARDEPEVLFTWSF